MTWETYDRILDYGLKGIIIGGSSLVAYALFAMFFL